jgi:hypothetical protein
MTRKTAFSMGQGLWQFAIMSFGPCSTTAVLKLLMIAVLRGINYELCLMLSGCDRDWLHIQRATGQPVEIVPRSPHEAQSRKVASLSEGSMVPQACCVT